MIYLLTLELLKLVKYTQVDLDIYINKKYIYEPASNFYKFA